MADYVTLERPREGVALVTMSNPTINNHGSWKGIGELAAAMKEAREGGSRAVVLASGVPGHWFEHAWLQDLADAMGVAVSTATTHQHSVYAKLDVHSRAGLLGLLQPR